MNDRMTPDNAPTRDYATGRDYAARVLAHADQHSTEEVAAARLLQLLLPAPTLAEMTILAGLACKWMQADVEGAGTRAVIVNPDWGEGSARVMWPGGFMEQIDWERVTPRPDLPRMEWPGEQQPAPALPDGWRLAEHPDYGLVIVTNATASRAGNVHFVFASAGPLGYACHFCDPSEVTYLDQTRAAEQAPKELK